jgi:RNA polymerase sigma-70 factor (ECF subfamily)
MGRRNTTPVTGNMSLFRLWMQSIFVRMASIFGMNSVMNDCPSSGDIRLEQYQQYLLLLAQAHFDRGLQKKLSPSDIVQQTLLKAYQAREQLRGKESGQVAAWLRKILVRTMCDAARDLQRDKRNIQLERSLESAVGKSSVRLGNLIAADQLTPSQAVSRNEQLIRLAGAVESLPEAQREAVILKHCEGLSLAEVGKRLGRSPAGVASLLRRGLKQVREQLQNSTVV